jgi:FkbM family methyltransferase
MGTVLSQMASRLPRRTFVRVVAYQYLIFEPELRHLASFVPSDRTAVDVGTWWGPWSWWLARRVPQVEAFEPNASICSALGSILPANVALHNVALSDVRGESSLWSPSTEFGSEGRSTLLADVRSGWVAQPVQTVPLDELGLTEVGFVKIDVEGAELSVLRGGTALLTRDRPNLLVEIEEAHQSPDNMDLVFEYLADLGYHGTFLRRGRWWPLSEFDRDEARRTGQRRKSMGLLRSSFAREPYVHNFLFVA